MVAFSASKLVCSAISEIILTTSPIFSAALANDSMVSLVSLALSTALAAILVECETCSAISATDLPISSVLAATTDTLAVASSAAAETVVERCEVCSAVVDIALAVLSNSVAAALTASTDPNTFFSNASASPVISFFLVISISSK